MSDRYRYRDRSPPSFSRHRDKSPDRYTERSTTEKYRSSRYRDRSRSRSHSYERNRRTDRHRRHSRSRRRSTSRHRYRDSKSRSPPPRHSAKQHSSTTKTIRSHRRSRSTSKSSRESRERSSHHQTPIKDYSVSPASSSHAHASKTETTFYHYKSSRNDDTSTAPYLPTTSGSSQKFETVAVNRSNPIDDDDDDHSYENYDDSFDEPIDKERIHREMEEKLRLALAKEGKIYPPPKPEPSHPVFANDGSFLEIFKKMQEQMSSQQSANNAADQKSKTQPLAAKRRGGKILKTGIVAKNKATDANNVDPKDFWSIYLQEVKKYKNSSCDVDSQTRPLVK